MKRLTRMLPIALGLQISVAQASQCTVDDSYIDRFKGFWLGQSIANWSGLVTEMDKIGLDKTGPFYTREDWGQPDQPNIWSEGPSDLSPTIDWVLIGTEDSWGGDDDTDIEYIYQTLMAKSETGLLSPQEIAQGWLKHIWADEENYLWVSNQTAYDLMRKGVLPPETSDPKLNPHTDMIDAQLTTEIFGLYAPCDPNLAVKIAQLPIAVSARGQAAEIANFYVRMHAYAVGAKGSIRERLVNSAIYARAQMGEGYAASMFDFVQADYQAGRTWEQTRDAINQRYQIEGQDGYDMTRRGVECGGCFAAGINYAASLVSLFYGEGDYKETVKIAILAGWDSDNPAATWGGLIGFLMGDAQLRAIFDTELSDRFNIRRTRHNFDYDIDTFERMAIESTDIAKKVIEGASN